MQDNDGLKYDEGKLRWDLLPIEPVEEIVKIITYGAQKYAPNSWQKVDKERYYSALMRHLAEWRKGYIVDTESGLKHLSHALCNLIFITWMEVENE